MPDDNLPDVLRDSCQHGTPYRYACDQCATEDAAPAAQPAMPEPVGLKAEAYSAYARHYRGELKPIHYGRNEHAEWNFIEGYLQATALSEARCAHEAARCISARNVLNEALHGTGAVIDDLELAVDHAARVIARANETDARCAQMREALEKIDIKAEAGLRYFTLEAAREFLKDIRGIVAAINAARKEPT